VFVPACVFPAAPPGVSAGGLSGMDQRVLQHMHQVFICQGVAHLLSIPGGRDQACIPQQLELVDFAMLEHIDYLFDGADEVDPQMRMIKGAGGAIVVTYVCALAATGAISPATIIDARIQLFIGDLRRCLKVVVLIRASCEQGAFQQQTPRNPGGVFVWSA